jgi:hypothetical protein
MRKSLLLCLSVATLWAQDYPGTAISNGIVNAKIMLPDADKGSYQGTRFDWSGIISSLEYKNHQYFGRWYEKHDPKIHDAITGPVEEFLTSLGYDEAKPGGTFIRIGVGVVRKPEEKAYRRFGTYDIVDGGKRTVRQGKDWIEFTQVLSPTYVYKKTLRLTKGKPQLVIEHSLKNTGEKVIDAEQYNHNFFVIDNEVVGPDVAVKFPFDPKPEAELKNGGEVRAQEIVYKRELEKGESVFSELKGFGETAKDYDFKIENRKSGAGVHITGDQPLEKMVFWSIRTVACPEPYVRIHVPPGAEQKWKITYGFYTLK